MSDSKDKSKQTAASSAVTPPSVMLLLAAKTRPANAQEHSVTDITIDNVPG